MSNEFSYWEHKTYLSGIDALVIGGGIVGMSTAFHLKKRFPNARVVIVERDPFSSGASTKNAGFACFGSPTELLDDLSTMTEQEVLGLVERRFKGLHYLRHLLKDEYIDYQPCGGMELFTKEDRDTFEYCADHLSILNQKLSPIVGSEPFHIPSEIPRWKGKVGFQNAIENQLEGSVDTGKLNFQFQRRLVEIGVEFFKGLNVECVIDSDRGVEVDWGRGKSLVKSVYICTNAFARKLLPELDVRPARNQVIVTDPIKGIPEKGTFHYDKGYVYFRPIHGRILLGGFRNKDMEVESTSDFGLTPRIQNLLEDFLYNYLAPKETKIEYRWSGILGLGENKTTIVKSISPHIHVGVRMGGMGVAIGSLIGKELADLTDL